jgi:diguanylate cyclase (GGDEF)-like protein
VDEPGTDVRMAALLNRSGRAAIVAVFVIAGLDWLGWATGIEELTRGIPSWPQMTPWTAVLLTLLGLAILLQWGRPSSTRVWGGRAVALMVGVMALAFLTEYVTHTSLGIDRLWFSHAVGALQATWPGRPSPQTASTTLLLSTAIVLTRLDRGWTRVVWPLCLAAASAVPLVTATAYLFNVLALVGVTPSTGMGVLTAVSLQTLVTATLLARPDRNPLNWLLARRDRRTLLRLVGILGGLPVIIGLSRQAFLAAGLSVDVALVFAITVSTIVLSVATFYVSQREQRLWIEKEEQSNLRAEAEARYRILADNAVDIVVHLQGTAVVHLHGNEVEWISPSVEAALGDPPGRWIGSDFSWRIHPDDRAAVVASLSGIVPGDAIVERFRIRAADGDYHWVDGHGKLYVNAKGSADGVIVALRVVDNQVEAQRLLEQLARFDTLTGLVNRAEALVRLDAALGSTRTPGALLGVLFCDIDQFKSINDTWGHTAGDLVLTTLATRIRDCIRQGDTVGRMGGDEMVVLLPEIHDLDEAAMIAEKIRVRASEPIYHPDYTIHPTLSIGVTTSELGTSPATVIARADVAMYQAKQAGRNVVVRIEATEVG